MTTPDLLPVRMLNAFTYCPRLFYLEWVQREWRENHYTADGTHQHRRVDQQRGDAAPSPREVWSDATSVEMSAPVEGLIARMDRVTFADGRAVPVDTKRGAVPPCPEGAWEPERVQVAAQGLILRENGHTVDDAEIYFAGSRRRIRVPLDDALVARTRELIVEARQCADAGSPPPPLRDSPKCVGCSLAPICLPDEVHHLASEDDPDDRPLRHLAPPSDEALPVYVREPAAKVRKRGGRLVVTHKGETLGEARLRQTSHLALFGSVAITAQALRGLLSQGVAVAHYSYGGWFYGVTRGHDHRNVERRILQFEAARDEVTCLHIARQLIHAKIANSRVLLRRNHDPRPADALSQLKRLARRALTAPSLPSLLGIEGTAARIYFGAFAGMLKGGGEGFDLTHRNRRPPRDPVNALLSFAYALLVKDLTLAAMAVGFDPYLGFYHQPRYGRPALALDLMEEFRPVIADSVVLTALNNREVTADDFISRSGAVALTSAGRKRFIAVYERRMSTEVTHPLFGYRLSYRQLLEIQLRLLDRHLGGEVDPFPSFLIR